MLKNEDISIKFPPDLFCFVDNVKISRKMAQIITIHVQAIQELDIQYIRMYDVCIMLWNR